MKFSVNEIEGLLSKAARGAGAPAAQAAAFGQAGALHIARSCDVAELQKALDALPSGAIIDVPHQLQSTLGAGGGTLRCGPRDLLRSYAVALPYFIAESENAVEIHLGQLDKCPRPARIEVDETYVGAWRDLAARIYVPETEASRLGGAGAGLTDND